MKLDELMHPGWGNAADYRYERDKKFVRTELKVSAVDQPQTGDDAVSSGSKKVGEPMLTLQSIHQKFEIPQLTSQPGSSRLRLALGQ
jgi:hypothetical protein